MLNSTASMYTIQTWNHSAFCANASVCKQAFLAFYTSLQQHRWIASNCRSIDCYHTAHPETQTFTKLQHSNTQFRDKWLYRGCRKKRRRRKKHVTQSKRLWLDAFMRNFARCVVLQFRLNYWLFTHTHVGSIIRENSMNYLSASWQDTRSN